MTLTSNWSTRSGKGNRSATDRFSSVIHLEGNVTSFYLASPSNASITQAVAERNAENASKRKRRCVLERLVADSIRPHSGVPYLHVDVGVGDDSGRLQTIGQGVRPLLDLLIGEV
jgi:hypothetical protein